MNTAPTTPGTGTTPTTIDDHGGDADHSGPGRDGDGTTITAVPATGAAAATTAAPAVATTTSRRPARHRDGPVHVRPAPGRRPGHLHDFSTGQDASSTIGSLSSSRGPSSEASTRPVPTTHAPRDPRHRGRAVDRRRRRRPAAQRGLRGRDRGRRSERRRSSATRFRPDLVVLDLMLPGLDGIEVCKQHPARPPGPGAHAHRARQRDRPARRARRRRRRLHDEAVQHAGARSRACTRCCGAPTGRADAPTQPSRCASATSSSTPRRAACASTASSCTSRRPSSTSCTTSRRAPAGSSTREELLAQVWGYDVPSGARTVDSHIRSIRRKLGADARAHRARRRLRGRGGARMHVKRPRPRSGRSIRCRR